MTALVGRIRRTDPTKSVLLSAIAMVFVAAFIDTFAMKQAAALMPRFLSATGLLLCLIGFLRFATSPKPLAATESDMGEGTDVTPGRASRYGLWMVLFVVLLWLTGLAVSVVLFTSIFLWVERRATPAEMIAINTVSLLLALPLGRLLNITWPPGALFSLF